MWVYIGEVFPNAVRAKGQSLGSLTHWMANAAISAVFPAVTVHSKALPFAIFAFMMVLLFLAVRFLYPETKNVSLEKMRLKI